MRQCASCTFLVASLVILPTKGEAQSLWRDLEAGDTPEIAEEKLSAMPEVKRVKTVFRRGTLREQDINMNEGGVPIFGASFSISTIYKEGFLNSVALRNVDNCADTSYELSNKIEKQIFEKYPKVHQSLPEEHEFTFSSLQSSGNNPESIHAAFSAEETTVFLSINFTRIEPPSYPIGGGALARSIYDLARLQYQQKAAQCRGTGDRRATISLTYMTSSNFDALLSGIKEDEETEQLEAANNL